MKIAEIETKIANGDVSSETIEQYKAALKKVPRSHRCQHCYTTAVSIGSRYYGQAIALIHYGLQYCDSWLDKMRAHYNIAVIYEMQKNYDNALLNYANALESVPNELKMPSYVPEFSAHLMRMEMHIHNFAYTDDLQRYYHLTIQADNFSRAFLKNSFYEAIAEIIIFKHDNKPTEMQHSLYKAKDMLSSRYTGALTALLKRKKHYEAIGATKEVLRFLKSFSL